jgi:hypothetical protein
MLAGMDPKANMLAISLKSLWNLNYIYGVLTVLLFLVVYKVPTHHQTSIPSKGHDMTTNRSLTNPIGTTESTTVPRRSLLSACRSNPTNQFRCTCQQT